MVKDNESIVRKDYIQKKQKTFDIGKSILENPPTYKASLDHKNWSQKVIGILQAGAGEHLYTHPATLLQNLVEKEYMNQVKNMTDNTIYSQFYKDSKNSRLAEASTKSVLYGGIMNQINFLEADATDMREKIYYETMRDDIQWLMGTEEMKADDILKQQAGNAFIERMSYSVKQYNEDKRRVKGLELKLKEKKLREKLEGKKPGEVLTDWEDIITKGLKPKEKIDRRVDVGDVTLLDIPKGQLDKKGGVREVLEASSHTFRKAYDIQKQVDDIKFGDAGLAFLAPLPGKLGDKERRKFQSINKGLIKFMLKSRIEFTGGGNMSEYEQAQLREFYDVKEGSYVLKDSQKIAKILMNKWRGDYTTLLNILKKDAFFNAYTKYELSPTFRIMTKKQRFLEIQKQFNVSKKDLSAYWRGDTYDK